MCQVSVTAPYNRCNVLFLLSHPPTGFYVPLLPLQTLGWHMSSIKQQQHGSLIRPSKESCKYGVSLLL
ncbi:hypothetical protein BC829DRAFT_383895, partial [Chytridium lagenaria]